MKNKLSTSLPTLSIVSLFIVSLSIILPSPNGHAQDEIIQKLQGKWVSDADARSTICFEGSNHFSHYKGEKPEQEAFVISDRCANPSDINFPNMDRSTMLSLVKSDRCFAIVSVDRTILNLNYVIRGNTLIYKKAKTKKPCSKLYKIK